jgi:hypothetical protein
MTAAAATNKDRDLPVGNNKTKVGNKDKTEADNQVNPTGGTQTGGHNLPVGRNKDSNNNGDHSKTVAANRVNRIRGDLVHPNSGPTDLRVGSHPTNPLAAIRPTDPFLLLQNPSRF